MNELFSSDPDFIKGRQIYLLLWRDNEEFQDKWLPLFQHQIGVRLDGDMTIFCSGNGTLYDIYKIDNAKNAETRMILQPNGQWNGSHLSDFDSQVYKVKLRTNLQNIPLVAVLYVSLIEYHRGI